jgi:electron transport complex protein RnfD
MEAAKTNDRLIVSVSPHLRSDVSVRAIMWTVTAALAPAWLMGVYYFGPRALWVTVATIASALAAEALVTRMAGRKTPLADGSAFLTGLLLAMNLPPSAPVYIPIVGAFIAVGITKQLFGGLGYNIFNPALIGRAFVLITWPRAMTTWSAPTAHFTGIDAATTATPLGIMKEEGLHALLEKFGSKGELYMDLLFGRIGGSLGEVSAVALLAGAGYLLYKRYITWHIPVSFMAAVAIMAWIFGGRDPETQKFIFFAGDPLFHLLSGGLMLGAWFMATDYVTAPSLRSAQLVFGAGCGLLTVVIRLWAGFPEGVMFAILLMNCFAPLIDRAMRTEPFGTRKKKEEKKA